jgi:tetratricopeptide (TPR) repeat protein
MARVRKPTVPDGPIRTFFERIHALHLAAGQPSMREMQRRTRSRRRPGGINPTTIHDVFAAPRMSRWEIVESVVAQLGGDVTEFAEIWRQGRAAEDQLDVEPPQSHIPAHRSTPTQLPLDANGFIGRAPEIAQLDTVLANGANQPTAVLISTVSGTAGVGKTTLAVHWAHRVVNQFPDGQLYVNLRGFEPFGAAMPAADAIQGFLTALGVPAERLPAGLDAQAALYRSLLTGRRVLVVLDNARDAEQVRPLLPGAPGCLAVVTSRNWLTGLVATEGAHPIGLDLLTVAESRELLARRLGVQRLQAEPDAADDIIARCARLPLALSVVAARAATQGGLPLATLAEDLGSARDGLDAFCGTDLATDLRAVFSWSYRTLSGEAARLFRLLGLHPGRDFTAPAAASLAGVPPEPTRWLLTELVNAHLLIEHTPGRFGPHDLLRVYAVEQGRAIDSASDRDLAVVRVLDHYVHTACLADSLLDPHRVPITPAPPQPGVTPEPLTGHEAALAWFDAEHAVLLAAIEQAASAGLQVHTWQLASAMTTFFNRRGHWHDRASTDGTALTAARKVGDRSAQAHAHRRLALTHIWLGRYDQAHAHLQDALALFEALGDRTGQAHTHRSFARASSRQGHYRPALDHAKQALDLYRTTNDSAGLALALNAVGWYHAHLGNYQQALAHCREALAAHQERGDLSEAADWDSLGYIHRHLGDHQEATRCYQQALELFRKQGNSYQEADSYLSLGDAYASAGDPAAAGRAWLCALDLLDPSGDPEAAAAVRERLDRLRAQQLRRQE